MPGVARTSTDRDTGHGGLISTTGMFPLLYPNVVVNTDGVAQSGYTQYLSHFLSPTFHNNRTASSGSKSVYINNRPVHRKGDSISCGDTCGSGSDNVICGG